jgi:hypothetical protein
LESYHVKSTNLIAAILLFGAMCGPAGAEILRWDWTADESQVKDSTANPPGDGSTDSPATGHGFVRYDSETNLMTVSYNWNNLFGELTQLHIHGPASSDMSTPLHVIETFGPPDIPASIGRHTGSWTDTFDLQTRMHTGGSHLTPAQIIEIMRDGLAYANFHTSVFGTGEIRGNLGMPQVVPEPNAVGMCLLAILILLGLRTPTSINH